MRGFILVMTFVVVIGIMIILSYLLPGVLGGVVGLGVLFLLIYLWWARNNLFFTFVKEGTAKIVVLGDAFVRILIQWKGYTVDDEWNVVPEDTWVKDGKVVKEGVRGARKYKEPWHILGGFRKYGLYPIKDMYVYGFQWSGVNESGEAIHHEKKLMDYIILKDDVYLVTVKDAEDVELLPLTVDLVLTIRIANPRKALFDVQNWLEAVVNALGPAVRDAMTKDTYENLIKKSGAIGEEILKAAREVIKEQKKRYGVDVRKIRVWNINPPEKYREKTILEWLAKQEKKKRIVEAEAEAAWTNKVYTAIQRFGDLGELIRTLLSVEKSPLAATLAVQAIPGIQEVLRGIFGKPPETVTNEELRKLRETVERLEKTVEKIKKGK